MSHPTRLTLLAALLIPAFLPGQWIPPSRDVRLDSIAAAPSPDRIGADIATLVDFGTRHTFSDTVSTTRGIGAARRWIHAEFEKISRSCGGCLDVRYVRSIVKGEPGTRITSDTEIVSVIAIQWGTLRPDHWILMSGDIDSRVSDVMDALSDSPGANDNASGMAGVIEAARVLSNHRFDNTVVYAGLAGEEQGLYGGAALAEQLVDSGRTVLAVLNNDMIGNITGITDQLEKEGMVERIKVASDRRSSLIRLTAKGKAAFAEMAVIHEEWINELFTDMPDVDRHQLFDLLGQLKRAAHMQLSTSA